MRKFLFISVFLAWSCDNTTTNEAVIFFQKGNLQLQNKEYKEAIRFFSEAIEKKADFADAFNNRGLAKHRSGDLSGALGDLNQALEIEPNYTQALYNRSQVRFEMSDRACMADLDKVAAKFKDSSFVWVSLGNAKTLFHDESGALAAYDKAITLDKHNAEGYVNRGFLHFRMKRFEFAQQDFAKALTINPKQPFALNNLSMLEGQENHWEKALSLVNRAIEVLPNQPEFLNNKGYYLIQAGQLPDGFAMLESSLRLNDKNAWAYRNRGMYYLKIRDVAKAIQDFEKAEQLDPSVESIYTYLGDAYFVKGNQAKACQLWTTGSKIGDVESQKRKEKNCL